MSNRISDVLKKAFISGATTFFSVIIIVQNTALWLHEAVPFSWKLALSILSLVYVCLFVCLDFFLSHIREEEPRI